MFRTLLVRGLLVGLLAGLLASGFAYAFGEPQVERAIAFEDAAAAAAGEPPGEEVVSRGNQRTFGLLTGICVYGVALGGLFALAFGAAQGRIGALRPRVTAAILAGTGFLVIYLVPALKYPPTPPAVGDAATLGQRTWLSLVMLAISLFAALAAYRVGRTLAGRLGGWNAGLAAIALYVALVALAQLGLPTIQEIPEGFPPDLPWAFRLSAIGTQLVLWTAVGLGFGALAERALTPHRAARAAMAEGQDLRV